MRVTAPIAALALLATVSTLAACGAGSSSTPSSSGSRPTGRSASSSSDSSSASSSSSVPACATPSAPLAPSPSWLIPCTSLTTLAQHTKQIGLAAADAHPAIEPHVTVQSFERLAKIVPGKVTGYMNLLVLVSYFPGGGVAQVSCKGDIGSTVPPTLATCTDLGDPSNSDPAAVRAWVVQFGKDAHANHNLSRRLTSGGLLFQACANTTTPKDSDFYAFDIELRVQTTNGATPTECQTA